MFGTLFIILLVVAIGVITVSAMVFRPRRVKADIDLGFAWVKVAAGRHGAYQTRIDRMGLELRKGDVFVSVALVNRGLKAVDPSMFRQPLVISFGSASGPRSVSFLKECSVDGKDSEDFDGESLVGGMPQVTERGFLIMPFKLYPNRLLVFDFLVKGRVEEPYIDPTIDGLHQCDPIRRVSIVKKALVRQQVSNSTA